MSHFHGPRQKVGFYLVKLPFILVTIVIGFMLEFLLELPFMIMCKLDHATTTKVPAAPLKPSGNHPE